MRHMLCLLLVLALTLGLSACGGEKKSDMPSTAAPQTTAQELLAYEGPYSVADCELRMTGAWLVRDSFDDTQFVIGFDLENRSQETITPYWTVNVALSQDGRLLDSIADLQLPNDPESTLMDYAKIETLPGGTCPYYTHSTLKDPKQPVRVRVAAMYNDAESYEFDVAIADLPVVEVKDLDLPPMEAVGGAEIVETHAPIELSGETAEFNYYDKLTLTYPSDFIAEDPNGFLYNLVSVDGSVKLGVYATDSADLAQAKRDEWAGYAAASSEYSVSELTVAGYPALVYTYHEPFTGWNAKVLVDPAGAGELQAVNFDVCTTTEDLLLGELVLDILNSLQFPAG